MPKVRLMFCPVITVDGEQDFIDETLSALTKLRMLPDGPNFLTAMVRSGKQLTIKLHHKGREAGTNVTASLQPGPDVLKFITDYPGRPAELTQALEKAAEAGTPKNVVAERLEQQLPITYWSSKNIGKIELALPKRSKNPFLKAATKDTRQNQAAMQQYQGHVAEWIAKLDAWCAGTETVPPEVVVPLIRVLRMHMTPGDGANVLVKYNPWRTTTCNKDDKQTTRPPEIGLIHEMIHAYYNMTGTRCFKEAEMDEALTTGLPPFQYERFTENKFRSQWPDRWNDKVLELRTVY